jgi:serine protease
MKGPWFVRGLVMKRNSGAGASITTAGCVGLLLLLANGVADAQPGEPPPQETLKVDYESGLPPEQPPGFDPTDIIVKFDPNLPHAERERLAAGHGCRISRSCDLAGLHLVRVPEGTSPPSMVEAFQQQPGVEYAELDYYATAAFVPDDTFFSYQWSFDNDVTGGIHMKEAWDITRGDPNVIVAIVDTGVAYEDYDIYRRAPDLAQTRFVAGYDFVNSDNHPNDDHGHGTHVAGTIAQSTNNLLGVAGVAFRCSVMPVKVLDEQGSGDYFTITQGIQYAVAHGARVINLSLGSTETSRTLEDAVKAAYGRGVTIVAAAGNEYARRNQPSYPAAYKDYCIAVGAVRFDLKRAPYSSTGPYVFVVAPGGDLNVDQNHDGYADGIVQQTFKSDPTQFDYWFLQGTSMAAPHVSGLAALLASRGVTAPAAIREVLQMTARDLGPAGYDQEYGWGMIDARAALQYGVARNLAVKDAADWVDLAVFAQRWLETGVLPPPGDLDGDHRVDFRDFAALAGRWGQPSHAR